MKLKNKLTEWIERGLIDEETAAQIRDYEEGQHRPLFLYAITGIGALLISLGLLSIIAANWSGMSNALKLTIDLLVGSGLSAGLWFGENKMPRWAKEVLLCVTAGWALASIALIGQIYQLGGEARDALLYWLCITGPFLALGRSFLSAACLVSMLFINGAVWGDIYLSERQLIASLPALAFSMIALGEWSRFNRWRPELASLLRGIASCSLASGASLIPLYFYWGVNWDVFRTEWWLGFLLSLVPIVILFRPRRERSWLDRSVLLATVVLIFGPLLNSTRGLDLIAILCFLIYWSMISKAALDRESPIVFRVATFLVAARIVIVYFELVGSLFDTGLLFLTGGGLILIAARFWYTKQQALIDQMSIRSERIHETQEGQWDEHN